MGTVVAIVGAECTGRTLLAEGLAAACPGAVGVPDFRREFCERRGRTPLAREHAAIAAEQLRRIEAAAAGHELVFADTTALVTAACSDARFGDSNLYEPALREQARYRVTLLTALDLPWQADGLHREGAAPRGLVDTRLRQALNRAGIAYAVIAGTGAARLAAAQAAVRAALRPSLEAGAPRWRHLCAECGDPDCERHLLARLNA